MSSMRLSNNRLGAAAALILLLVSAAGLCSRMAVSPEKIPHERYFRAVHVLRQFSVLAAEEPETVPRRVMHDDETESLLHHPDRILVLRRVAADLAACRGEMPRAPLFEAYARLALGERQQAAYILTRHVVENPYDARHYALLCETLYAEKEFAALLLMCREWTDRDKSPHPDRARYLWAALYNLGRYADAEQSLADQGASLGWRALVYSAKTALARGQAAEADKRLKQALDSHPGQAIHIERLWDSLKTMDQV